MAKTTIPWRKRRQREILPPLPKRPARGGGGKHSYDKPQWRFGDLITGLGTDRAVAAKLVSRGYPTVPENSITGWRLRNSIPSFWVPIFLQLGIEEKLIRKPEDLRLVT